MATFFAIGLCETALVIRVSHRGQQQRNLTKADYLTKLLFGNEQTRTNPAFDLITLAPALHITADGLDNRERRLDDVSAG